MAQALGSDLADSERVIESLDRFWSSHATENDVSQRWPIVVTLAERTARSALEKANRTLAAEDVESARRWVDWLHNQERTKAAGGDALALADPDKLLQQVRG